VWRCEAGQSLINCELAKRFVHKTCNFPIVYHLSLPYTHITNYSFPTVLPASSVHRVSSPSGPPSALPRS
jgi:hypothetical protein